MYGAERAGRNPHHEHHRVYDVHQHHSCKCADKVQLIKDDGHGCVDAHFGECVGKKKAQAHGATAPERVACQCVGGGQAYGQREQRYNNSQHQRCADGLYKLCLGEHIIPPFESVAPGDDIGILVISGERKQQHIHQRSVKKQQKQRKQNIFPEFVFAQRKIKASHPFPSLSR